MSYLIIELETQLLKTGKTSSDLIRATGHTPANISNSCGFSFFISFACSIFSSTMHKHL